MSILEHKRILGGVLSVLNKSQNTAYPPSIYSSHINIATSFLLSEVARIYGTNQSIIELGRPFFAREIVKIEGGIGNLPKDYRHLLSVGIATNETHNGKCSCSDDEIDRLINTCNPDSPLYVKPEKKNNEQCAYKEVEILIADEFYSQSSSSYRPPSHKKPIALLVDKNTIKVCPKDVTHIEVMYLRHPKEYAIGVKLMPDDTWQIDNDSSGTIESEWELNAEAKIITAMVTLYSMYSQDRELKVGIDELKKMGLF